MLFIQLNRLRMSDLEPEREQEAYLYPQTQRSQGEEGAPHLFRSEQVVF